MAEREHEVFHPEEVDEQIDEYLSPSRTDKPIQDTSTYNTINALQQHFVPSEQEVALQRVWQHFEQQRSTLRNNKSMQQQINLRQKGKYHMKQVTEYTHKKNNSPLIQRLGLIAAVIVVVLLISSMAIVLQLAPDRQTRVAQPGSVSEKMMFTTVNGTLYRLDTKTHQPLWRFTVPAGADGKPGVISSRGQAFNDTYYISGMSGTRGSDSEQNKFYALNVENGQIRWQRDINPHTYVTPTISDTTLSFTMQKDGYLTIIALDPRSGTTKWEHRMGEKIVESNDVLKDLLMQPSMRLIAASDKAIYGMMTRPGGRQNDAVRFALNAQNGNVLWQKDDDITSIDQGFLFNGILCVAKEINKDPKSSAGERQGILMGYDAESGEQRWSKQLDGPPSMYGTTVLNNVIYLSAGHISGNSVYAFSIQDGSLIWQYRDTDKLGSSHPTVTEKGVYINRYGGEGAEQTLVALDTKSGKVRWTYKFRDGVTVEYPPAADKERVYLSLQENKIQILQASDGKPVDSFKIEGKVDPYNRTYLQIIE